MSKILWVSEEVDLLTGGHSTEYWAATGICLRVQDIRPGDLFFAAPGDPLSQIAAKGAAAVVVTPSVHVPHGLPALVVPDVFDALQALARAARFRTHATVISVQSRAVRNSVSMYLGNAGHVHMGGRHQAQSLAALPPQCDYAVMGLSPHVRPDVLIITDPAAANQSMIFEQIDPKTAVLIDAHAPGAAEVAARARAAGLQSVLTYGSGTQNDASIYNLVQAKNGERMTVRVMGETQDLKVLPEHHFSSLALACAMALCLSGMPLAEALAYLSNKSFVAERLQQAARTSVSLMDMLPGADLMMRVKNMIDFGGPRRTLVLEALNPPYNLATVPASSLNMPRQIKTLDTMYTSKIFTAVPDACFALMSKGVNKIADINTDVVSPGDVMVFKKQPYAPEIQFSKAIRLIPA
jgi:hypothetical protein